VTEAERRRTAIARAHHLAVDLSATAAGVFEPTDPLLDALAQLASALAFDLAVAA
jgi:hypothetical protein